MGNIVVDVLIAIGYLLFFIITPLILLNKMNTNKEKTKFKKIFERILMIIMYTACFMSLMFFCFTIMSYDLDKSKTCDLLCTDRIANTLYAGVSIMLLFVGIIIYYRAVRKEIRALFRYKGVSKYILTIVLQLISIVFYLTCVIGMTGLTENIIIENKILSVMRMGTMLLLLFILILDVYGNYFISKIKLLKSEA